MLPMIERDENVEKIQRVIDNAASLFVVTSDSIDRPMNTSVKPKKQIVNCG